MVLAGKRDPIKVIHEVMVEMGELQPDADEDFDPSEADEPSEDELNFDPDDDDLYAEDRIGVEDDD